MKLSKLSLIISPESRYCTNLSNNYTEELMIVNTIITIHYLQGLLTITLSLYFLAPPKTEGKEYIQSCIVKQGFERLKYKCS